MAEPTTGAIALVEGLDGEFEVVKVTDHHVGLRYVDRTGRESIFTESGIDIAVRRDRVTIKEEQ